MFLHFHIYANTGYRLYSSEGGKYYSPIDTDKETEVEQGWETYLESYRTRNWGPWPLPRALSTGLSYFLVPKAKLTIQAINK